jgi:hypothetical protein
LDKKQEKWAIFWCDLLNPVIYEEIEPELTNLFLKSKADEEIQFPDGRVGKPSLKTLRRKLNRYRLGGFDALSRKGRSDRGKPRNIAGEIIEKAIELKKEQPFRSPNTINRFLEELYGQTVPRSTLYRHLKQANATRLCTGILNRPTLPVSNWVCFAKRSANDGPRITPMTYGSVTLKMDRM